MQVLTGLFSAYRQIKSQCTNKSALAQLRERGIMRSSYLKQNTSIAAAMNAAVPSPFWSMF